MDWFLVILAVVGFVLTIAVSLYLVALYCSEEDKNQAWMPKIIVVVGLSLSAFAVLLLPFDVANKKDPTLMNGETGGVDVALMWQLVLWSIAAWLLVITPFATFYYESWDPAQTSLWNQVRPALCYTFSFLLVFMLMFVILWLTVGYADLAFEGLQSPPVNWDLLDTRGFDDHQSTCVCSSSPSYCVTSGFQPAPVSDNFCLSKNGTLSVKVSAFVYIIGLICAIGWFSFIVFGGAGIIALPMDLINDWRTRPQRITRIEYNQRKEALSQEIRELLQGGFFGSTKKKINKFGEKVSDLEDRSEKLEASMDVNRKVLVSYLKLPIGVLGLCLSFMWILHIILNNVSNVTPFLNNFFVSFDNFFPLFGTIAYTLCAMWMLWAAVKGCFKIGVNVGIISIHPMKVNDTLMSSFLFNTLLVLITSVTVAQFCSMSFRKYASNTVVDSLFASYVNNLRGIGYVMQYFQYAFLGFSGLSFIYLVIKPCCCRASED
eukprot:TRINITY_DN1949_c0_g1_i2.p1 TRINITY_DN1949_c0_g1~~TRINITY_DN1949_c0_g1_i2.p1  ORF type:complete len:498 (+),score=240.23 TRINITY_DN1949_c0_g1_i2:28-1494(+)